MTMEFEVRCRECDNCLAARSAHWRYRARAEIGAAPRTWFGTLTFKPERHYAALCAVHLRLTRRGVELRQVTENELFRLLAVELGKELTTYLKRLRKAGAVIRYLMVTEAHKTGKPHFHMLVHEQSEDLPVRHRLLKDKWAAGFSDWKLVEGPAAASYVTKYLSKSMKARVRASEMYGSVDGVPEINHQLISANRPTDVPEWNIVSARNEQDVKQHDPNEGRKLQTDLAAAREEDRRPAGPFATEED